MDTEKLTGWIDVVALSNLDLLKECIQKKDFTSPEFYFCKSALYITMQYYENVITSQNINNKD